MESEQWLLQQKLLAEENSAEDRLIRQRNTRNFKIRWHSKRGEPNLIIFADTKSMPQLLRNPDEENTDEEEQKRDKNTRGQRRKPLTEKDKACAITGKPARYRDPYTGLPYHDLAAYKALRVKYPKDHVRMGTTSTTTTAQRRKLALDPDDKEQSSSDRDGSGSEDEDDDNETEGEEEQEEGGDGNEYDEENRGKEEEEDDA